MALLFCLLLASLFCLLLALLFCLLLAFALLPAVAFALLGSFHHRSSSSRCPRTLVASLRSCRHRLVGCGSVSRILTTYSLAVVPLCAFSSESLYGGLRLRGCPRFTGSWVTTTRCAVCEVWSERFSVPAARRCSPVPLCGTLSCVRLHNEGFHRGLLSGRGLLIRPTLLGVSILVSLSVVWLLLKICRVSCHCHTLLLITCAHDFLSLSGHRNLLRNVICTAVACDCASYSRRFSLALHARGSYPRI